MSKLQRQLWYISDANFVITGATACCHSDNLRCHHKRQSWHHRFSVTKCHVINSTQEAARFGECQRVNKVCLFDLKFPMTSIMGVRFQLNHSPTRRGHTGGHTMCCWVDRQLHSSSGCWTVSGVWDITFNWLVAPFVWLVSLNTAWGSMH